ncbi:MAG: hypothetical protein KTR32_14005 [Granulosicoccus sp.]|nr:hypothetical protein [Granulosicoccus sp.]
MTQYSYPHFPTYNGYLTESIRQQFITQAIASKHLPENAHRMRHIVSLAASNNSDTPIHFWQLFSVLGQDRIVKIVRHFYELVFADEEWFTSVFARIGGVGHHVNTQSGLWIDVMGGGLAYHGGEFRLNFHHTHNAMQLMNDKGAERWIALMVKTLDDPSIDMTDDARVRPAINTFLTYFLGKYASEFKFSNTGSFGELNPPVKKKINLFNMTSDAIEALTEDELIEALSARGIDVSDYKDKSELVNIALRL